MKEFFDINLNYNDISFRFAKGKSLRSGNEIHPFHEILYFIDSDATFLSNSYKENLKKETLLIIPKEMYHKFQIKDQSRYARFVINFPDFPEGAELIRKSMSKIKIAEHPSGQIKHLLNRMCFIAQNDTSQAAATALFGLFLSLLYELCKDTDSYCGLPQCYHPAISRCLAIIDKEFSARLTIATLSEKTGISTSSLLHLFKKETGISLHRYITQRRIIYAHKLLSYGENPTQIYWKCGYQDYSSFYKAYVKVLGISPSQDFRRQKT